jgi:putative addiction module component (TIGR02574 family)
MTAKESVIAEALKLSEAERLEVAEMLFESVEESADPGADAAWAEEIERRLKSIESGEAEFMTKEQATRFIMGDEDDGITPD